MLKLSDTWNWYYDHSKATLMLELDDGMLFQSNLKAKDSVPCTFQHNQFNVDDAQAYNQYYHSIAALPLSAPRQTELNLNCVAAKRFHKPVQPKSWFFDSAEGAANVCDGMLVELGNVHNHGLFIVVDAGESASIVAYTALEDFYLTETKSIQFGAMMKVMHDRMTLVSIAELTPAIPMVS